MIVHGFVTRPTKDIDLFTESDDLEAGQVVAALHRALEEQDLLPHDTEGPPLHRCRHNNRCRMYGRCVCRRRPAA